VPALNLHPCLSFDTPPVSRRKDVLTVYSIILAAASKVARGLSIAQSTDQSMMASLMTKDNVGDPNHVLCRPYKLADILAKQNSPTALDQLPQPEGRRVGFDPKVLDYLIANNPPLYINVRDSMYNVPNSVLQRCILPMPTELRRASPEPEHGHPSLWRPSEPSTSSRYKSRKDKPEHYLAHVQREMAYIATKRKFDELAHDIRHFNPESGSVRKRKELPLYRQLSIRKAVDVSTLSSLEYSPLTIAAASFARSTTSSSSEDATGNASESPPSTGEPAAPASNPRNNADSSPRLPSDTSQGQVDVSSAASSSTIKGNSAPGTPPSVGEPAASNSGTQCDAATNPQTSFSPT